MSTGTKHTITCSCIFAKLKNAKNPPQYRFTVFSVIDDDDNVIPSFVTCSNCGVVHKIVDLCKSEIIHGKEGSTFNLDIDELKTRLPEKLVTIVEKYKPDIATWEYLVFAYENNVYDKPIVLSSELIENVSCGKYVKLKLNDGFTLGTFSRDELFSF